MSLLTPAGEGRPSAALKASRVGGGEGGDGGRGRKSNQDDALPHDGHSYRPSSASDGTVHGGVDPFKAR